MSGQSEFASVGVGRSVDGVARVGDESRAISAQLRSLGPGEADIAVSSVMVARPSLDDVYLRHVGRSFEVAA